MFSFFLFTLLLFLFLAFYLSSANAEKKNEEHWLRLGSFQVLNISLAGVVFPSLVSRLFFSFLFIFCQTLKDVLTPSLLFQKLTHVVF